MAKHLKTKSFNIFKDRKKRRRKNRRTRRWKHREQEEEKKEVIADMSCLKFPELEQSHRQILIVQMKDASFSKYHKHAASCKVIIGRQKLVCFFFL